MPWRSLRGSKDDLVGDRDRLLGIGMTAVFGACAVFAVLRLVVQSTSGHATPWWGNAGGAVAIGLLRWWVRRAPSARSTFGVHGTALTATLALLVPAAYGMTSSKWWLVLVPFSVLLMGRRKEAAVWATVTLVLLPLTAILEPRLTLAGSYGEPPLERALSAFFFLVLVLGITWAFRRVADQRAVALAETAASLDRANRVRGRFLAHMSHELRTPLHGVIAMTDLAMKGAASEEVYEQVATAQQSARVLLELLNNILDVTRAEADAIELDASPFDLHAILADVLRPFEMRARAKGLELVARSEPEVVERRVGDRVRVAQIVMNLVSNALKFTREGSIEVAASEVAGDPDRVRICVRDTGRGISDDAVARIFEPFAQVGGSDEVADKGAGLGLAIVRELARRMDGAVEVASEVGRGATFTVVVRLPREPGASACGPTELLGARSPSVRAPAAPAPERRLTVLVCEDDATSLRVASLMLKKLGHDIVACEDGLAAWSLLADRSFDVLLTDIEMPGIDGIELTRRLRALESEEGRARMPIIAATAHVGEDEFHRLLAAGVDVHVPKPFTLANLAKAIDRVASPLVAPAPSPAETKKAEVSPPRPPERPAEVSARPVRVA